MNGTSNDFNPYVLRIVRRQPLLDHVECYRFLYDLEVLLKVEITALFELRALRPLVVELEEDAAASLEVPVTQPPVLRLLVGKHLDLGVGGAHQTHPVVGGLLRQRRNVTEQVVDFGTAVAAVEGVSSVVADRAPVFVVAEVVAVLALDPGIASALLAAVV